MDLKNPLYKNQGIHVDISVFTVEKKEVKMLLVKRCRQPFSSKWTLPGGAVYNNESIDKAAKRELKEKTGLKNLYLEQFYTFGKPSRDPRLRMVAIGYLALIDKNRVEILQKTSKTLDAQWFSITNLPKLAFDHRIIALYAIKSLKNKILNSNLALELLPKKFTLLELQNANEIILGKKFDRRNFRRKFLNSGIIITTGEKERMASTKPGILYSFLTNYHKETNT